MQQQRINPTRAKWIAAASITASYLITMLYVENKYVLFAVGVSFLVLLAYLFSKPDQIQQATYQQTPELHQPVT